MNTKLLEALKVRPIHVDKISSEELCDISSKDIQTLCENNIAYKIKHNILIGKEYLTNHILLQAKQKEEHSLKLFFDDVRISPNVVAKILDSLVEQKLLIKHHEELYVPNIEEILTKEAIKDFCKYRIDVFSIADILNGFGFVDTLEITAHGFRTTAVSTAYEVCNKNIIALNTESFLIKGPRTIDNHETYCWNVDYQEG